jgi:hypothetical protein
VLAAAQIPKTVAERLGYPANSRLLVIHADDLGMLHLVNKATIEALNKKWITSDFTFLGYSLQTLASQCRSSARIARRGTRCRA